MTEVYPEEEYMNDLLHERQGPELDEDFDLDEADDRDYECEFE